MGEMVVFAGLGSLMLMCAVMVVISRNPIASAIFLVVQLFMQAGLYAAMGADFVAAIQVLIYAGAIMVLFVFVIMLLNLRPEALKSGAFAAGEMGVLLLTIIGFVVIGFKVAGGALASQKGPHSPEAIAQAGGNTFVVGMELFTKYLWPFELASILILLAIVASIVIAKKRTAQEENAY